MARISMEDNQLIFQKHSELHRLFCDPKQNTNNNKKLIWNILNTFRFHIHNEWISNALVAGE